MAVLYVGRLSHEKGVDVLLAAWPDVVRAHPEATLTLVGDGPERARLEAQCAELAVHERVVFAGHQESPWPWYAQSAVVVLPSRSEGIPNVLLEAIARDLRVVATDAGGIPGVLGSPPAGLMVPRGDTVGLRDALITALAHAAPSEERSARARVRASFSVEARARELSARYRALLRSNT
jgi:glycosyltransferase involved in cell wall biosynthesis